jgi:glycosyltransferase involved in cell wall biosynthesis
MNKEIRIVQLIDSLNAGGAERMAINYANTLADVLPFSGLVTTRKEGPLKAQVSEKARYLFLNKQGKLGFGAVLKLRSFIKQNKVNFIHAHSSSFFTAVLVKLIYPKVKIVWHDHYGNSEFLEQRSTLALKSVSFLFQGIISVNLQLAEWAAKHLKFKNVIYLPNFVFFTDENQSLKQTNLNGTSGKRIICLANLRAQKNHLMLLAVANILKETHPDWSFHLVGKDFEDDYAELVKKEIANKLLENQVFIYGSRNDVGAILNQSDIAILTSKSEGLPVALLEYGYYKIPVLSTSVGEIATVIENNVTGILVPSEDVNVFYTELVLLIDNPKKRKLLAYKFNEHVAANYSEKAVISNYVDWLAKEDKG